MKVVRISILLALFTFLSSYALETKFFLGVSPAIPFPVSFGAQSFGQFSGGSPLGLLTRGDLLFVSSVEDSMGNSTGGCFLIHFVPGLSYKYKISDKTFLYPKLGPSINFYILPGNSSDLLFGFGISPGVGISFDNFEIGLSSNYSFKSPVSFANWVCIEIGWSPK